MPLSLLDKQITETVEKLSESVVSIHSSGRAKQLGFSHVPVEGSGSGVIIDSNGHIITNYHVIDGAARVDVHLKDGRTFPGVVAGTDPLTDIALIKVEAGNLPAASLGDSDALKAGQLAIAIGNALGLPGGLTVSVGVISALERPLPGADFIFEGLVQTDAAINPGNSGGPLADIHGNVIGINTAMIPFAQGVGFAIPINTVKRIIQQIYAHGRVIRPWLGISGIGINHAVARRFGISAASGVLIVQVYPDSPAYESGLKPGDVLVQIGNQEIRKVKDIISAISQLPIGELVAIHFERDSERRKKTIKLMESPITAR